jgi:hypothetical protein
VTVARGTHGAWGARIRVGCLLGCLVACAAYALDDHAGPFSAQASGAGADGACKSFLGAREADIQQSFATVRAQLTAAIPPGSRDVDGGVVVPATLWLGGVHMTPLRRAPAPALFAGYRLSWSGGDGDGETDAQVFFLSPQDARRFVGEESSVRCRRAAVALGAPPAGHAPPGSRAVRLSDPDGDSQTDVFFARGRYGYEASASASARGEQVAADEIACALPGAGC